LLNKADASTIHEPISKGSVVYGERKLPKKRSSPRMSPWAKLVDELNRWYDGGARATLWWRDDDAVDYTPQLDTLLKHAGAIPLALAVIPGLATQGLAARLAEHQSVVVLQHGWRHANHAPDGHDEYPASRSLAEVSQELVDGRGRLAALFGPQAIPVFAPPWHRFAASFLPLLARNGFIGISRKGPRPDRFAAEGVFQANAHMAPITWSRPPSFGEDELYLDQIITHLRGRRLGHHDATEVTGLLTHHLAQNDRSYAFIARFVAIVSEHPACIWVCLRDLFPL
jgi:hypothetical protein